MPYLYLFLSTISFIITLFVLARYIKGEISSTEIKGTIVSIKFHKGSQIGAVFFNLISVLTATMSFSTGKDLDFYDHQIQKTDGTIITVMNRSKLGTEGEVISLYEQKNTYMGNKVKINYLPSREY